VVHSVNFLLLNAISSAELLIGWLYSRGNGVTQNQLCKELGTPANNFFYVVKRLESWGLVTRQSTIVRTKEASTDKESKSNQPVHTNLIRLHRYAAPLDSQQRLEITKENKNLDENLGGNVAGGDCILEEHGQDDVLVKDFLPALKAVCDRLEQAEGKVCYFWIFQESRWLL